MMKVLSKSFLSIGGEVRPVGRDIKTFILDHLMEELDPALLNDLSQIEVDMLFYVLFRIKPSAKLSGLGLTGAKVADMTKVCSDARRRVLRSADGMQGLDPELSNLEDVAVRAGWENEWYSRKTVPAAKKAQPALPQSQAQLPLQDQRPVQRALPLQDGDLEPPAMPRTQQPALMAPILPSVPRGRDLGHVLGDWEIVDDERGQALVNQDTLQFAPLPTSNCSFWLQGRSYRICGDNYSVDLSQFVAEATWEDVEVEAPPVPSMPAIPQPVPRPPASIAPPPAKAAAAAASSPVHRRGVRRAASEPEPMGAPPSSRQRTEPPAQPPVRQARREPSGAEPPALADPPVRQARLRRDPSGAEPPAPAGPPVRQARLLRVPSGAEPPPLPSQVDTATREEMDVATIAANMNGADAAPVRYRGLAKTKAKAKAKSKAKAPPPQPQDSRQFISKVIRTI